MNSIGQKPCSTISTIEVSLTALRTYGLGQTLCLSMLTSSQSLHVLTSATGIV